MINNYHSISEPACLVGHVEVAGLHYAQTAIVAAEFNKSLTAIALKKAQALSNIVYGE